MSTSGGPSLRYNPALDGIRALAVLAVIAVHQQFTWLPGGFYGVDAFFVLSGFLITSLLVVEWRGTGGVALGRFWARRARRLLPALYLLVVVIGVVAAVWPEVLGAPHLLENAVATLFYSANWYFIAQHVTYFSVSNTTPSPLLHTWSLAIEEQFYLVWPLVVLGVLTLRPRRPRVVPVLGGSGQTLTVLAAPGGAVAERDRQRRLEILFAISAFGALASAVLMAVMSPMGTEPNRTYYGTDTRAQALLVGAAVALAFARWGHITSLRGKTAAAGAALVGAVGTALLWILVPETSSLAFHGGFLLAALATAGVVVGAVAVPASPVPRALAVRPLRALGRISYGVYLWYWPVLLVLNGARTGFTGFPLFVLRVVVTVGIAAVSYHLVEQPIRRGALPSWKGLVAAPIAAGVAVLAMVAATLVPASATAAPGSVVPVVPAATHGTSPPVPGSQGVTAPDDTARPLRVLLLGDSVAGSLGVGLSAEAPRYGVQLVNEGSPGCSLSMDEDIRVLWYTVAPGAPCQSGNPGALLDQWRRWVDAYNPDVVVYLARGELFDQQESGQWENIGEPSFDRYLAQRFAAAAQVLGSRGASVVLMTTPYYDSGDQPSGAPWPEDAPARADTDNAIITKVVTGTRGSLSLFDLGALVSPGGAFATDVDGITMRCGDGVHFTAAAGEWLASRLFPRLVDLGRSHQVASPSGAWPGPLPAGVPSWWYQLPCR